MVGDANVRLYLASHDPLILHGVVRPLLASGVRVARWPRQNVETDPPGSSAAVLILGVGDIARIVQTTIGVEPEPRLLVGVSEQELEPALSAMAQSNRPRLGDGIFRVDGSINPLTSALSLASEGYLSLPTGVLNSMAATVSLAAMVDRLSDDERRLMALLATGMRNTAIAEYFNWPESQVKTCMRALMRRLRLPNRTAAAVMAFRLGINRPN
jgi:DNA-binding NarL/FixJ family response regulator